MHCMGFFNIRNNLERKRHKDYFLLQGHKEVKGVKRGFTGSQWHTKDSNSESLSLELMPLTISDETNELTTE